MDTEIISRCDKVLRMLEEEPQEISLGIKGAVMQKFTVNVGAFRTVIFRRRRHCADDAALFHIAAFFHLNILQLSVYHFISATDI